MKNTKQNTKQPTEDPSPETGCIGGGAHLGLNVRVVVVLQEQGRGLGVVLAGSDVQGRQAYLALCIVLQQQGDHLVMALLEGHRQRREAVLRIERGERSVKWRWAVRHYWWRQGKEGVNMSRLLRDGTHVLHFAEWLFCCRNCGKLTRPLSPTEV